MGVILGRMCNELNFFINWSNRTIKSKRVHVSKGLKVSFYATTFTLAAPVNLVQQDFHSESSKTSFAVFYAENDK